jgi:hypothetical protein
MKLAAVALFAALPLAAAAQVSKDDIKKLAVAGVSDDVILTFVRANGGAPRMSADDLVELKKAGAGDRVLASLAGTSTSDAAAEAPSERVVERPVYVTRPTYVYSTPYAGSGWCGSHYAYDSCGSYYYYRPTYLYASTYPRYWGSGWYGHGGYYGGGWGVGLGYSRYWGGHCGSRYGVSVGLGWRW